MQKASLHASSSRSSTLGAAGKSIAVVLLAATLSCGEPITQVGPDDIVALRIAPDSVDVGIGKSLQANALPLDATGALLVGQPLAWRSDDAGIASVDDSGEVTGVSAGSTTIVASVSGLEASLSVRVALPPVIALSSDSVRLDGAVGDADSPEGSITVTNTGELALGGLSVDSIVYGVGADGWVEAALTSDGAPTSLNVEAAIDGITTAGHFEAWVWLSAPGADNSPASARVSLVVAPGAPAAMAVLAGDGQAAQAGASVDTRPSVRITDSFGNGVAGASVAFTVAEGGGSVTGAVAVSGADGVATVGSWTLGTTVGTNRLTASSSGLAGVSFAATSVPGAAASLIATAGDNQSARAGEAVTAPMEVQALDAFDNPVAGVEVTFSVQSGGGSLTGGTQSTDADGRARLGSWTLGSTPGSNALRAVAAAIPDTVTFSATGLTGDAVGIERVAGDLQTDTVGGTLSVPYAVRIVDSGGNGVPGVPISWEVTSGGGSFTASTPTDGDGIATAVRVLGTTVGTHTARAAVGGLSGSPIEFSATATTGSPAAVEVVEGDGQSATVNTTVPVAPRVRVEDRFGNPIAGHPVGFSVTAGGGSVSPTGSTNTGPDGTAGLAQWRLGTTAGTDSNVVSALAAGVVAPASFTATALAGAPGNVSVVAGDGQTAITGESVSTSPTVRVADQYGNAVSGVTVAFAASGSGSTGSGTATTNATGSASTSWTVSTSGLSYDGQGRFANSLTATVQGTAISTTVDGWAIYSYRDHVDPIWAAEGCTGCHGAPPGGTSELSLGGSVAANYDELVGVVPFCDSGLGALYRVVSDEGGDDAADSYSILMRFADPALALIGGCDSAANMVIGSTNLAILHAWIRNGAPEN